jgi:protein-S-isoprenylcysteine O-methyltransferase Ste14
VTFVVVIGGALVGVVALLRGRDQLLLVDYGTNWALVAVGACLLGAALWLRLKIQRDVPNTFLVGLPELEPHKRPQRLVRTGVYGRVRHPRYAQFFVALGGYTLIANYLGVYLIWLLWIPGIYVTVLFEERELRARFGEEYEQYCREIPRFIPKLGTTVPPVH